MDTAVQAISSLPAAVWWVAGAGTVILITISVVAYFVWKRCSVESLEPYLSDYTQDIQNCDLDDKKGLLIIVWMHDVEGTNIDAKNMKEVASTLGFAVLEKKSPSRPQFRALVKAAKDYPFIREAPSCKVIFFYYAGHGGSDSKNLKPFVAITKKSLLNVEEIVSPLEPINAPDLKDLKRLFFFDMCQGRRVDSGVRAPSEYSALPVLKYAVPAKGNCLVAFSGSIGYSVRGESGEGGYWTRHLIKYLDEDMDIHIVLAKTWKDTVIFTSDLTKRKRIHQVQGPSFFSCMGPLNLTCINEDEQEKFESPKRTQRSIPGTSTLRIRAVDAETNDGGRSKTVETDNGDDSNIDSNEDVHPTLPSKFSSVPNSELDTKHLVQILSVLGSFTEWKKLGLNFGLLEATLDAISDDERGRVDNCTREMLSAWLKWKDNVSTPEYGRPSWRRLLDALEPINSQLATKIERSRPWISKRK